MNKVHMKSKMLVSLSPNLLLTLPRLPLESRELVAQFSAPHILCGIQTSPNLCGLILTLLITSQTLDLFDLVDSAFLLALKLVSQHQGHFLDFGLNKHQSLPDFVPMGHFVKLGLDILDSLFNRFGVFGVGLTEHVLVVLFLVASLDLSEPHVDLIDSRQVNSHFLYFVHFGVQIGLHLRDPGYFIQHYLVVLLQQRVFEFQLSQFIIHFCQFIRTLILGYLAFVFRFRVYGATVEAAEAV